MVRHTSKSRETGPPGSRFPRASLDEGCGRDRATRRVAHRPQAYPAPSEAGPPVRPIMVGAAAALVIGFVLDIGPWTTLAGRLLGTADAQEAQEPQERTLPTNGATPSEADRAALRYFAREGDVDRLEAELRRLRALYPGWQPPRDLLDPQGEDTELQRTWDLVGAQRYEEARQAIFERRQRDPSWTPPAELTELLEIAAVRGQLTAASDTRNYAEVLSIAEANERILTCEDPDSIWRVAEAFAATGRSQRAYDAYAYVVGNCAEPGVRAASLQKAAAELDPALVSRLFDLGVADADGRGEFDAARLDIVRGAVALGGERDGVEVPQVWLELLAEHARTRVNLDDAMLVGYYLNRQGSSAAAAEWFRFALDNGLGADAAEGYILALRATGDRDNAFLAREVAYQWREQTPELMEAYLDAMATLLTDERSGAAGIDDVEQGSVDRFVPIVIEQRDANGAQALGWYAFNTCQFIIAEEWFITSANWVPTEAAIYGLALSRLRLGDAAGFAEVLDEWGALYPSVRALGTGEDLSTGTASPLDEADPASEVAAEGVVCDPAERERLRGMILDQGIRAEPVSFTEAGSLTALPVPALAQRPDSRQRQAIPRRSVVIRPEPPGQRGLLTVQATVPPLPRPELEGSTVLVPDAAAPTRLVPADPVAPGRSTVERRVRSGLLVDTTDGRVSEVAPQRASSGARSAASPSTVQQALGARDFDRCVATTDSRIRARTLTGEEAAARGFCLLELQRPFEAAEAFELARTRARFGSTVNGDAAYGATLAAIAADLTDEAAVAATLAPQSRARRTEVEISILSQRAIAANRNGRYTEALHYLDQRNRIAPLQKDLMLLQAFAYQNAGYFDAAERLFRAVNQSSATPQSLRAVNVAVERRFPPPVRPTFGGVN